jgi:lauroyl/myristoyl acyltransferase
VTEEPHAGESQDGQAPSASLPARLYASKYTHRLLPAPIALALARMLGPGVRMRRDSEERRAGVSFMTDLLLYTPRADEAEELAERWLVEKSLVGELFWRPWLLKRSRILERERWDAAHQGGRGCLIVIGHIGPTWATSAILARHGLAHHLVVGAHYWDPPPPGYRGLSIQYRRREYGETPLVRLLSADGPPERPLELLEAGESVLIAFDVAGSAATPFLGRSVALAGGPATLASRSNAMVLPAVPERRGARIDLRLLPPIDPAEHRDPRSLRAAIAQAFEPVVLGRPEAVELAWYPSPLVTETPPAAVPQ